MSNDRSLRRATTTPIPLSQTSLAPKLQALCRRSGLFNLSQVLCKSPAELCSILRLRGKEQAEWLLDELSAESLCGKGAICIGGKSTKALGKEKAVEAEEKRAWRLSCRADIILSTGDRELDAMLHGGVPVGMLTEVVGESSSAKSQFAMQLAAYTALGICSICQGQQQSSPPSPSSSKQPLCDCNEDISPGGVALLFSEGTSQGSAFVKRMSEIAGGIVRERRRKEGLHAGESKKRKRSSQTDGNDLKPPISASPLSEEEEIEQVTAAMLVNVHVALIKDTESLEHTLRYTLPALAEHLLAECGSSSCGTQSTSSGSKAPLRLIIFDSLPALFYDDQPTSMNAMVARSKALCSISDDLKRIASIGRDPHRGGEGGSAVLVINHVSDAFEKDVAILNSSPAVSSESKDAPPLVFAQQAPFISGLLASFNSSRLDSDLQLVPPRTEGFPTLKHAALGQVWNNCINARIMLNKTGAYVASGKGKDKVTLPLRKASLIFAPHLPPAEIAFIVTKERGVCSMSTDDVRASLVIPPREEEYEDEETTRPRARRFSEVEETVWTDFDHEVKGEDLEAVMGEFE